ncbi:TRAP transporter substrate-binding protein [Luteithermobacter gelatinilyticus]|uniref:TRAP transporter substrate-binding protein n=1 Tax=Luteithermobacter gelatinilyticus TaxID=2582913 RepID=UPI00143D620E|nr:TRAP transporter substrate-binding protein DctP [Luteithermobacter gelatinilyticus]
MRLIFPALIGGGIFCTANAQAGPERRPEDELVKLTVGAFAAPGSPWDVDWQTFRRNLMVHEGMGPEFRVKLLIRGEAGGEPITMTNIRRNRMQFGGFTIGGASAVVPELSMLLSPYVFENTDELDYVMDHYMLDVFQPLFAEKGLVLIRWVDVGWLSMYGKKPIRRPQDAKGYRLRSQASEAAQVMMESLNGDLLQMEFQDVVPSLQTGLIEGGETNVVLYSVTGLASEAPHLMLTRHAYDTGVIVANKKWFDSLSPRAQERLRRAFPTSEEARAGVRKMTASLLAMLRKNPDVTVHDLTVEERAAWIEATRDNHKRIIAEIGGQAKRVYEAMIAGRDAYRNARRNAGGGQ